MLLILLLVCGILIVPYTNILVLILYVLTVLVALVLLVYVSIDRRIGVLGDTQ